MSESSNPIAKRRARDGVLYTCAQFEAHYGKRLGRKQWREANVDGSGASEHNSDDGTNTAQANVEGGGWHWWNEPNQAAVNVVQEKDAPWGVRSDDLIAQHYTRTCTTHMLAVFSASVIHRTPVDVTCRLERRASFQSVLYFVARSRVALEAWEVMRARSKLMR